MSRLIIFIVFLFTLSPCHANTIVRLSIQKGAVLSTVDLNLFETKKPVTVSNFLGYVDDGSYDNSFIHRKFSLPGLIIQGGGFAYDENNSDFATSQFTIPVQPPIVNEPGISNIRGTIAMAKVAAQFVEGGSCTEEGPGCTLIAGTGPDSATSQWFFNLSDNSDTLDTQNGGFTVFGEVFSKDLADSDRIADTPDFNQSAINSAYQNIPLNDFTGPPLNTDQLLRVISARELFNITPDPVFGLVAPGTLHHSTIVITNTGKENLQVGDISPVSPVNTPFVVDDTACINKLLLPGESCVMPVIFSPNAVAVYVAKMNIKFQGLGLTYGVTLSGASGNTLDDFFKITPNINFGTVTSGSNVQPEVIIENTGSENLQLGNIAKNDKLAAPFVAIDSVCRNRELLPAEKCAVAVVFTPTTPGIYNDTFDIELPQFSLNQTVSLTGTGSAAVNEPDLLLSFSSILFGSVSVTGADVQPFISQQFIQNNGTLPLTLNVSLQGPDQDEISLSGDCLTVGSLSINGSGVGSTCSLNIHVAPITPGKKEVTVVITSNDPDESPFLMPVSGKAILDNDDIASNIEDSASNGGDGNNDGALDSRQSHVASLQDMSGTGITFATFNGLRFSRLRISPVSNLAVAPDGVNLNSGLFDVVTETVAQGAVLDIGLIYPENKSPDAFYIFGPTIGNKMPHWHEFVFDGETGIETLRNASITAADNTTIRRNVFTIRIKDGGRGDADLTVDGKITLLGAASISETSNAGGGSGMINLRFLLSLSLLMFLSRSSTFTELLKRHSLD